MTSTIPTCTSAALAMYFQPMSLSWSMRADGRYRDRGQDKEDCKGLGKEEAQAGSHVQPRGGEGPWEHRAAKEQCGDMAGMMR